MDSEDEISTNLKMKEHLTYLDQLPRYKIQNGMSKGTTYINQIYLTKS